MKNLKANLLLLAALVLLLVILFNVMFVRVEAPDAKPALTPAPPREETPVWTPASPKNVKTAAVLREVAAEDSGASTPQVLIEDTGAELLTPIALWDETTGFCRADVPMPEIYQAALYDICAEAGVDINLALGLIQLESTFNPYAVSETGCYGYCQLSRYFPANLSPEENLRAGIGWLGELLARYGDAAAALTVYHLGSDDGTRDYANVVLRYAREWGYAG